MWKSTCRRVSTPAVMAALAAVSWCAPAWVVAAETDQPAVWTPKELQFTYQGFTTRYTCDGLRDKVRSMLLDLGARKDDLKVYERACAGDPSRPNPFPGVAIKMNVLQPAPPGATTQTVPAHWERVDLPQREFGTDAAGECELLEQVKQKILPLFTTRNAELHANCVPHQLQATGARLRAEVLKTDQKKNAADKPAAAAEPPPR
jgi:hypothetical protein